MKSMVTMADVAREAAVSIQTVSRVLNKKGEISPATRRRVLEAIERLGYRPNSIARGLVTARTQTLGLVVPDIANPFFPEIARGAENTALQHGYTIFLCNTNEDPAREEAVLDLLEGKRVDGLILCGSRLPAEQLLPLLRRHKAVVLVNRQVPGEIASSVRVDDLAGARLAAEHLLTRGRRHLAFLAGPTSSYSSQMRTRGFLATLEAAGLPADSVHLYPCKPDSEGGSQATRDLLTRHPEIDGFFCYNDLVAVGALQACAELGIAVPERVAVIGYDNIPLAALVTPALTTLGVSKTAIGERAVQLLLKRLADNYEEHEIVLAPRLILRASAP